MSYSQRIKDVVEDARNILKLSSKDCLVAYCTHPTVVLFQILYGRDPTPEEEEAFDSIDGLSSDIVQKFLKLSEMLLTVGSVFCQVDDMVEKINDKWLRLPALNFEVSKIVTSAFKEDFQACKVRIGKHLSIVKND